MVVLSAMTLACSGPKGGADALPSDVTASDADAADATGCPDGLIAWPGGGCVPRVDECPNPWDLPPIGGGCVAIGPRACPKLWDPEADVDCEPGQLMEYDGKACPEGFVLTEDEVACIPFFAEDGVCGEMEIPVLGGGCKKVGPDWYDPEAPNGGLDVPYFDECGPGLLALEGGGCVQVGPRACPKLWDPEADVGCKVGDVLPCPEGWSESDDGMYCDPTYGECGPGERSLVGGGCERVVPLAEDCPPGPFPQVPEGAKDVVYVSAASTCTEGCGAQEAPFPTIAAALEAVPDGGYVLVGAGAYSEGLLIQKPVHVVGLCSASVKLSGTDPGPELPSVAFSLAGVWVANTQGVELGGIAIESQGVGLAAVQSKEISAHDIELVGSSGAAVYAGSKAEVQLERLWIHDTKQGEKPSQYGYGVEVTDGGKVALRSSLVEEARGTGVDARDKWTFLEVKNVTVRNTQSTESGLVGMGGAAALGAELSITESLLELNRREGVACGTPGTKVFVDSSVIRDTHPDTGGHFGFGISAAQGCALSVRGTLLVQDTVAGINVEGPGTAATIVASVVDGTQSDAGGHYGMGVQAVDGCVAQVFGSLVRSNRQNGILAAGPGTLLAVAGGLATGTLPAASSDFAAGLWASDGAKVEASFSVLDGNSCYGAAVSQPGATVELTSCAVRGTVPAGNPDGAAGLLALSGGRLTANSLLVEGNSCVGLALADPGTAVEVIGGTIRGTSRTSYDMGGYGVQAAGGATLYASHLLLLGNESTGVQVSGNGSQVTLDGSLVGMSPPGPNPDVAGLGILAVDEATLAIDGCLLEMNGGLHAHGTGTHVSVVGSVIRDTLQFETGSAACGLLASSGCSVALQSTLLERNLHVGVGAGGPGTAVTLDDSAVLGTLPGDYSGLGRAIEMTQGVEGSLTNSLIEASGDVVMLVGETGTAVSVDGSVFRASSKQGALDHVGGVGAQEGAVLTIARSLVEGLVHGAVRAVGPNTTVTMDSDLVRRSFDAGLVASDGGTLTAAKVGVESCSGVAIATDGTGSYLALDASVLRENEGLGAQSKGGSSLWTSGVLVDRSSSMGLLVSESGTAAELRGTIIRGTSPSAEGSLGVGLVVQNTASGSLLSCLLADNSTAGVMSWGFSHTTVDQSAVTHTLAAGMDHVVGGKQVYGDGLMAGNGGELVMDETIVSDNARNGVYYNQSSGSVTNSVIVGNDFYGLAMEECAGQVAWEGKENHVIGNASALPPDKAAQVTTSTGGMAVPPAPEMICIPPECNE